VINSDFKEELIVKAIEKALSKEFVNEVNANCVNPYGDGRSAERILELIINTPIDNKLIVKDITY
jgi:GDP/UDP-N,N'-diacetylbacillosamine 2-epimerase (hydrolysing)